MNSKVARLLMAPALAGALFGVTMMDTQGTAEAAGPRWKGYAKPAGVDCRLIGVAKDLDTPSTVQPIFESGSTCANNHKATNWIGIKQYGKFNQANGAIFSQNISQIGNSPNGDVTNTATNNYAGFDGSNAVFVQANININKNRIKVKDQTSEPIIEIEIAGRGE